MYMDLNGCEDYFEMEQVWSSCLFAMYTVRTYINGVKWYQCFYSQSREFHLV
jgi:hypothetical protein